MKPLPTGLDHAFAASGAAAWGGLPFSALLPHMSPQAVQRAYALCPGAASVLVAAYPYYAGPRPGNLSLYARGEDYHRVLIRHLTPVCHFLSAEYPGYQFLPAADNSPLPEREAAWGAGLGLRGEHGLLILPPYGSYVFLGTILTDAPLAFPPARPAPPCEGCGACRAACPTGALGDPFQEGRCLSHLTQKKGVLPEEEQALLAAHDLIWGCDCCQRVCPHNREAALSPLAEFRADLMDDLAPEQLEGLSNRTFQAAYGERAFAWRGPAVLRRNLGLHPKQVPEK